ncbi:hypothetical protein [Nocardioides sp. YIM 152315]|uniref:hypothetical protein n=1 Tax=Nocardioides sp. YIM 152315 TaxID=3031760 RepID=UPI0023DB0141|nr:hypothetical protein [Nocardioides sp. YIM 152315]MDF1603098.1 hypothetical protein [Nocardioides sp. YIM 152315]
MLLWIIIGIAALAVAGWAFWPRRRGVVDGEVRRSRLADKGSAENYNNPSGPNFGGPF